jgi:hypothetical protein
MSWGSVGDEQAAPGQHIDVIGLIHRHNRCFQAIGDRARLFAGAAMRRVDGQRFAGRFFLFSNKYRIDFLE